MAAEAARVIDFENEYYFGSTAPAREIFDVPETIPAEIPIPKERTIQRQRERAAAAAKSASGVSLFAIFGSILAAALMVFVVLAQINYNEAAAETVKLNNQLRTLTEQQRRLEITYESVIDIEEVERYARDVLGMSRPQADQIAILQSAPKDMAEILGESNESTLNGLGEFLVSLTEYFR